MEHKTGLVEKFELIDLDASATEEDWAGRLVHRETRRGNYIDVNYKTWTPTELAAAPDRQWQMDAVTDSIGNYIDFTYATTQYGGRWCIETAIRDDGFSIEYNYGTDGLESIDYPGGGFVFCLPMDRTP